MENTPGTQQREFPHLICNHVWMWSVFSEEKGLYFNGYALKTPAGGVLIDPPSAEDAVLAQLTGIGSPVLIVITNRDHERSAGLFRQRFGIPVAAHHLDAPLMEIPPEQTFADGDSLLGGLQVIHIPNQKSPGESALYWPTQKVLILGDALIGKPAGSLSMLPDEKYTDRAKAFASLKRTFTSFHLDYQTLLLGDGEPILNQPKAVLEQFLNT